MKKRIEEIINKKCTPIETNPSDENYRDIMIENHRRLWRWIAYNSLIKKEKISKSKYFEYYNILFFKEIPYNQCFLCEYTRKNSCSVISCTNCPVKWKKCLDNNSLFNKWRNCYIFDYIKASYYAWRISTVRKKNKER